MNAMKTMAVLFAGLVVACCSSGPPYPARAMEDPDRERLYPVQLLDEDLVDLLEVGRLVLDRVGAGDFLQVQVSVRNVGDDELQLSFDVQFLDATDNPYGDRTPRRHVILRSGDTELFSAMSSKARAANFVMRIGRFK